MQMNDANLIKDLFLQVKDPLMQKVLFSLR